MQASEYSENHTVLFFLCTLAALTDREQTSVLPEYDAKKKWAPILVTTALNAIETLFPERVAKNAILEKFKTMKNDGDVVDFCKVIWLIMDHYISETRRKATSLRNKLQGLSEKNDVRTWCSSNVGESYPSNTTNNTQTPTREHRYLHELLPDILRSTLEIESLERSFGSLRRESLSRSDTTRICREQLLP